VTAKAERDGAVAVTGKEVQEVLVPTPGCLKSAVHKHQWNWVRSATTPLFDHFQLARRCRTHELPPLVIPAKQSRTCQIKIRFTLSAEQRGFVSARHFAALKRLGINVFTRTAQC
jgi:hypothetical protein